MDGAQPTLAQERQPSTPETGAERLSSDTLEAQQTPMVEASQNKPKADDGAVNAQAVVAAVSTDDAASAQVAPVSSPTPVTAADVDVIEPEWVKRAEEAVAKNREDPHAEESAVEELQREYLKARYNLDVKAGDEG